jgi:hypothetical protein
MAEPDKNEVNVLALTCLQVAEVSPRGPEQVLCMSRESLLAGDYQGIFEAGVRDG